MAYAPTVHAEAGITSNTAKQFETVDGQMRTDALSHADVYSGLHATIAILAALRHRDLTGEGQYIDIAMAAVMLSVNERVHVDLGDVDLGAETPILGATDCPFFIGPGGERFVSSMSLVSSLSFPLYLIAMRRLDLMNHPRFLTPELRKQHLSELHTIVQQWIWTFSDMATLDAQLDLAKIATGQVRHVKELAASQWAEEWSATEKVSDRAGGEITVPGRPWHFSKTNGGPETRVPALQGEHNDEVLGELGFSTEEISELRKTKALIQPSLSAD